MLVGIIRKHDRVYEFWVVGDPVFKLILVPALFNSRDLGRVASLRTTLEESTCIAITVGREGMVHQPFFLYTFQRISLCCLFKNFVSFGVAQQKRCYVFRYCLFNYKSTHSVLYQYPDYLISLVQLTKQFFLLICVTLLQIYFSFVLTDMFMHVCFLR